MVTWFDFQLGATVGKLQIFLTSDLLILKGSMQSQSELFAQPLLEFYIK